MKAKIEIPDKLKPVFLGHARYRGAYGGRGSAKTYTFAKMAAVKGYEWAMAGKNGQILCGREYQNSLKDSSFVELAAAIRSVDWLNDFYEIGENYIRTKCGRVFFAFTGLRHNLDSIKSKGRILLAWVDEAENVSDLAWEKLIPTVREDGSEIWVTWNPESPDSATHMRFREDPPDDAKIVQMNYTDNPWFPDVLENERQEAQKKRPDTYKWIWEGEFNENQVGSVYAKYLTKAKEDGRITKVPYKPGVPVITAWDLGKADSTSIWFAQRVGFEVRVIDFYENTQEDLSHYAEVLRSKPYEYSAHYLPHDAGHERLGMKGSIKGQLNGMGLNCVVLQSATIASGIELGREMLKTCYIDEDKCKRGVECLRKYKYMYDEQRKVFMKTPMHDWTSHAADAFRYLAQAFEMHTGEKKRADFTNKGSWMA